MKIKYQEEEFLGYIDLMYHLLRRDNENIDHRVFPRHSDYYIRAALEDKFNKRFTLREVKKLLAEELALGTITLHNETQKSKECT